LFWSFYNLVVLAAAMAVCIELPRASVVPRLPPERVKVQAIGVAGGGWMMRLTTGDAWIRGGPPLALGTACTLVMAEVGLVIAKVARVERGGFSLALAPDVAQRQAILAKLHTRVGAVGTTRTNMGQLLKGLAERATRRF
jgi:cellulose synthase (UDP-forming)